MTAPTLPETHAVRPSSSLVVAAALLAAGLLASCSMFGKKTVADNEPTLKSLGERSVDLAADPGVTTGPEQAAVAYRDYLRTAPRDRYAVEAMRRLGDLEMDSADNRLAGGSTAAATAPAGEYRGAIAQYRDFLKAHPNEPGNDRVLYQLARAHELSGELDVALQTLDRLVQAYPQTPMIEEAQFRRGELLFTMRSYPAAEKAFATVLRTEPPTLFHDRSLYMMGWSQFKQARLDEALQAFFSVLDLKLAGREQGAEAGGELASVPGLTRADREVLEDTLRVVSISLQNLQGAESIPVYTSAPQRRAYEFRIYEALGELYGKQERIKDAADTFAAFGRRNPQHPQAPLLQARVIDIYQEHGFASQALGAKREYVERYGAASELRKTHAAVWQRAQPLVRTHLTELARHFHAGAQKSKSAEDQQQAIRWYRELLASFPADAQAAQSNFLLAELLFETKRFSEAAAEYEKAAYKYPVHAKSADAGYAALLSIAEQGKSAGPDDKKNLQLAGVDSALRFAAAFPQDTRTAAVLTNAAERLYALGQADRAATLAQQVLALQPPPADAQRRTASLVLAHASFERGRFDAAEARYRDVLGLTAAQERGRGEIVERLAASIYKQGEQARGENRLRDAVSHFARAAAEAPASTVAATAQYDAAAALLTLKDWNAAATALEAFRKQHPNHALQAEVGPKLALAYLEQGRNEQAGAEFERIAATSSDPTVARGALWQAAELHEKAGAGAAAVRSYEKYVKQYPQPLTPAIEARYRLALLAKKDGNRTRTLALMKDVLAADQAAGNARTDRSRYLGASAALALAEPAREAFSSVALVEPLQKQLKLKKAELEQYNVLLEEQAFPFEEKALELHEANARRAANGVYDAWVKRSYAALAKLRPVRFGKNEISVGVIDANR